MSGVTINMKKHSGGLRADFESLDILHYGQDQYITCTERMDSDKLHYIVSNPDIFGPLLKKSSNPAHIAQKSDPLLFARKYLERSRAGRVRVLYKQKKNVGRFYARKSLSLQSLSRKIRQTICGDFYCDVDIKNCHPNLLLFACGALRIPCPILQKYCTDRDKFFEDNGVTKEVGKVVFLAVMYGGSKEYNTIQNPSADLKNFYVTEIRLIHDQIAFHFQKKFAKHETKREKKDIKYNHKASFMAVILCDMENKVLQCMWEFFGHLNEVVLCFDGIMIPGTAADCDIKACEKYILDKVRIPIQLDIKPFTEILDLSLVTMSKYPEVSLKYYLDFENLVDKEVYPEWVEEWRDNGVAYINNYGKSFFVTRNKSVDPGTGEVRFFNEQVKREDIFYNLDVDCRVINPKFDRKFYARHYALPKKTRCAKLLAMSETNKAKLIKYDFESLGSGSKAKIGFLRQSLKKRWLHSLDGMTFYPYLERLGQPNMGNMYNTFAGFPLESVQIASTVDFTKSRIYKHVGEEMMTSDDEFDHFLDHIADLIQDPADIKTNAHLFYSRQGMGKGMLAKFMNNLLGHDHVISLINTDAYFGKFNYSQSEKLLKIFEEISDKGTAFHNHDRLKGEQSMDVERVEPKYLPVYEIRHCARFWYFTNNENALFIEGSDRRFTCHRANNRYANNFEYFKGIWAEVNDRNFCRNAFEFFANRKYTMESAHLCRMTDFKKEQKLICLSNGLKFLKELVENDFNHLPRDGNKFKAVAVNQEYRSYCTDNGTKFSVSAFKLQLRNLNIIDKSLRFKGKNTKCYVLSPPDVLRNFRDFLKDDCFQFDSCE